MKGGPSRWTPVGTSNGELVFKWKHCDKSDISDQSSDYRAVLEVFRDPPYWLRDSYMAGYRNGTVTLFALSAAVAAALGRSPYGCTEGLMPLVQQA